MVCGRLAKSDVLWSWPTRASLSNSNALDICTSGSRHGTASSLSDAVELCGTDHRRLDSGLWLLRRSLLASYPRAHPAWKHHCVRSYWAALSGVLLLRATSRLEPLATATQGTIG